MMVESPARKAASCYVNWEEVNVSGDKERREVRYYLKRRDGYGSDLAVIGKEKSSRHMSYHYVIRNKSHTKLRSRRDVIDWLNTMISDSPDHELFQVASGLSGGEAAMVLDADALKCTHLQKPNQCTKEFLWLGSHWTCRKRRIHYKSFCRNGIKVSVHDFVFVLAEESKRLVAYLEDMYEDSRGNKMVMVRWFHKTDEVGIALPHKFNDREIFFSLCLQDLHIECIDGLATVLSPRHFKQFLNESTNIQVQPFVCHWKFDNDDVKPFDITQVKGYWEQEILRYMLGLSSSRDNIISKQRSDHQRMEKYDNNIVEGRPKKRHRRLIDDDDDDDECLQQTSMKDSSAAAFVDARVASDSFVGRKNSTESGNLVGVSCVFPSPIKEANQNSQLLRVGAHVEVLSQDSGIIGCWFRASIIKKHKNKVKLRYSDIRDADDEANFLEEWVLASEVALPDQTGLRLSGRATIRPSTEPSKSKVSWAIDVGTLVDVWWHDGWWEGIVVQKQSEDKIHVFFPGEKQNSFFARGDLRHSREWLGTGWTHLKERPDVVHLILASLGVNQVVENSQNGIPVHSTVCVGDLSLKNKAENAGSPPNSGDDKGKKTSVVRDLSNDDFLSRLRWKSSKKRKRSGRNSMRKFWSSSENTQEVARSGNCEKPLMPASIKLDHDNCKYMRDTFFSPAIVSPLTNLVMSR